MRATGDIPRGLYPTRPDTDNKDSLTAWATTHRHLMNNDFSDLSQRAQIVNWCLSHQDLFLTKLRSVWEAEVRLYMNLVLEKDHKHPAKVLGPQKGSWVDKWRAYRASQEKATGQLPDTGDYAEAMDNWCLVINECEERRGASKAAVSAKEQAAQARERMSDQIAESMELRMSERGTLGTEDWSLSDEDEQDTHLSEDEVRGRFPPLRDAISIEEGSISMQFDRDSAHIEWSVTPELNQLHQSTPRSRIATTPASRSRSRSTHSNRVLKGRPKRQQGLSVMDHPKTDRLIDAVTRMIDYSTEQLSTVSSVKEQVSEVKNEVKGLKEATRMMIEHHKVTHDKLERVLQALDRRINEE